ncbi:hypothetical protein PF010_g22175 [Phytophthora fragariae]|uniref:Uncharacterized protein n=1 Tax=Phytophthora fragariae TaxID=53985 RepID=A0A6A3DUZ9_9STRA|nr:hypothetical protein PF009_g24131 [Phytophthora fragariae]KAE9079722.1 hypothetical protein PF007_g23329 [Phytophthora fragariae]KAE9080974.1 hypothetical protein PF010_g22175 [Phytophthora fragariae]KAE9103874.1 hypothetical protein PF006_g22056 [Phytophthora fragariae]
MGELEKRLLLAAVRVDLFLCTLVLKSADPIVRHTVGIKRFGLLCLVSPLDRSVGRRVLDGARRLPRTLRPRLSSRRKRRRSRRRRRRRRSRLPRRRRSPQPIQLLQRRRSRPRTVEFLLPRVERRQG